jgi:hypothetical protein
MGLSGGTVAVDKSGDTYRFGIQLEERAAVELTKELAPYLQRAAEIPPPSVFS